MHLADFSFMRYTVYRTLIVYVATKCTGIMVVVHRNLDILQSDPAYCGRKMM